MNKLYIGLSKTIAPPTGGCLFIHDEVPSVPRARIFDPAKHCFNPLKGIDYKKARQLAEVLYTVFPQGENTLTVRNGKRALLKALLASDRLDRLKSAPEVSGQRWPRDKPEPADEVKGMADDLLTSPVLRRVLCNPTDQFSFRPGSTILARVNRAELGDFDALVLGLFLMAHFPGQLVIPDFGFYGREAHVGLIRENRLIAGVNTLEELPPKLRQNVLLIKEKVASGTTYEDAVTLARYARLRPDPSRTDNPFNAFVDGAMA